MKTPSNRPSALSEDGGPQPTVGGAEEELNAERASATPLWRGEAPPRDHAEAFEPVQGGVPGPLADLQSWFSQVMTHPDNATAGVLAAEPTQRSLGAARPEHIVQANRHLSATQRMQIYNYAYHSRLVGCVKDDFEAVGHALGAEVFEQVCLQYVKEHPSKSPNLNIYAQHFPEFVAGLEGLAVPAGFLADLARLEWRMIEVVHAPPSPPMDLEALQTTPPERWAELRLFASPTLRFEHFDYPVNAYFQGVMNKEAPVVPAAQASDTAIYRQDWRVWRMGFTPTTAGVLRALLAGQTLGQALATLQNPETTPDGADVMKWFQEWMSSGFFCRYEI